MAEIFNGLSTEVYIGIFSATITSVPTVHCVSLSKFKGLTLSKKAIHECLSQCKISLSFQVQKCS